MLVLLEYFNRQRHLTYTLYITIPVSMRKQPTSRPRLSALMSLPVPLLVHRKAPKVGACDGQTSCFPVVHDISSNAKNDASGTQRLTPYVQLDRGLEMRLEFGTAYRAVGADSSREPYLM
jgi:hypothetical protein